MPIQKKPGQAPPVPDFRALFEAVPGLYLILLPDDPDFTIAAVNQAYAAATFTRPEEIIGRGLFEVFPGVENLRTSLRQVIATKAKHAMAVEKYDIRRPDGSFEERFWSPLNTPLLGENGEVTFIIHRMEDGTELAKPRRREHREIQSKLLASEARFSLAFAQAPIGMVLLTPDGRILEMNQAYVDSLGYSRSELEERDTSAYTHPDDIELTRTFFRQLKATPERSTSIEKRYIRKDGEILWARASGRMQRDDDGLPALVIATVEDITERKRAEARYQFLAESIPQMVWTATPDGMLDYVNRQGISYFGVPQPELMGTGWLAWVHPDDRALAVSRWTASLKSGAPYEISFRLKRGDGVWRWHLVRALPLAGDDGGITQWFGTCTDIEDQKQADANLREQWNLFDTALSHTPDFVYTFDLAGRFTYANRALLSLLEVSLDEIRGRDFFDLQYPPELAERLQRQIQQAIDTKKAVRDHTPFTSPEGQTGHYEYIFAPARDVAGRVRAVAGSTRDVTEQTTAAEQIEQDRRRWRELLEKTPAAIAVLSGPEHRFEWMNPPFAALLHRTQKSLLGKSLLEGVPESQQQVYIDLLDGVYRTGESFIGHESPVLLDRGDGVLQNHFVNFAYLANRNAQGQVNGIFVHITDVTDMVLARKRVEESERQFRTLAETIPHLAWMADDTGNIFWYNRRWYEYTGTTLLEMEGWGWEKVHDPEILPTVLREWRHALTAGEPFEMIYPLRRADGVFGSFLTRVEPVKDENGNVVRWFGTNTDITEQRRTEKELRRMNRELEEFAYVASHDLQEPLRMVNIYTQLILQNLAADKEKLSQYSGFVREGVRRMEALIHGLLSFSRSVHTEELQVGEAVLDESCAEALAVLKKRIEDTGAKIGLSPLPAVRGETSQMAHVFQNVLSNSIKYRREGVRPEIEISAVRSVETWTITIRDNGIGFEPEYAERIFGLFKRLHKDEYPGTGLGLAICKRIVERYGGRMWAEGTPGEGASFHFSLPTPGK